jgi:hypothetical protein
MQNKETSLTCGKFLSTTLNIIFRVYYIALFVMLCYAMLVIILPEKLLNSHPDNFIKYLAEYQNK